MTIFYNIDSSLYVNITNKCPCNCVFCVRLDGDTVAGSDSLWLEKDPDKDLVIEEFNKLNLTEYKEIVFCGYGECFENIDLVKELCKYFKEKSNLPIRINTNGLGNLINGRETAYDLEGLVDTMSISLNAPNAKRYEEVSKPSFGVKAFDSLIDFISKCSKTYNEVIVTVVDVITDEEIKECEELAKKLNVKFRVRKKW